MKPLKITKTDKREDSADTPLDKSDEHLTPPQKQQDEKQKKQKKDKTEQKSKQKPKQAPARQLGSNINFVKNATFKQAEIQQ